MYIEKREMCFQELMELMTCSEFRRLRTEKSVEDLQ